MWGLHPPSPLGAGRGQEEDREGGGGGGKRAHRCGAAGLPDAVPPCQAGGGEAGLQADTLFRSFTGWFSDETSEAQVCKVHGFP